MMRNDRQEPLVPCFRELEFINGAQVFDPLTQGIERRLKGPWERDRGLEEGPILRGEYRVFRRHPSNGQPGLLLHLMAEDERVLVANIVPTEVGQLTTDDYNAAIVDFTDRFARPAARELGIEINLGSEFIDLESELPADVYSALTAFSRTANRSTGSAHPMDRDRWFDFLVRLYRSGGDVPSWVLQEWLTLDGWPESTSYDLIIEYEFGMGLLRYVEQH